MTKKSKKNTPKTKPGQGKGRQRRPIPRDVHIEEPSLRDMPLTIVNLPRYLILAAIRGYQATFSRTIPVNTCRFYPSCSHYGYMAIYKHGALKGSLLAAWRVLRCNPFNPGGYDPVP